MTRFARAKGSKSSNEKKPEEATSWAEMKNSMLSKKSTKPEESEPKQEVKINPSKPAEWASLGDDSNSTSLLKKNFNNRNVNSDKSNSNNLNNFKGSKKRNLDEMNSANEELTVKKNKKNKNKKNLIPDKVDLNINEDKLKKKNKKRKSEENSEAVSSVKKKKLQNTDETAPDSKEKISQKDKKTDVKGSKKFQNAKKENKTNYFKKEFKRDFKFKGNNRNQFNGKFNKHSKEKNFKNNNFMGGSSEVEELIINGEKIPIIKFQGFYVTLEDAERLKKLRSEMIKEGIPKAKLEAAIKLERRRAEKALSRLKKLVCFHCRSHGHLLSNCPELKENENTSTGICYKCGSTEHSAADCKVIKGSSYQFAECFICKEQGHIARQCPDNPRGLYPQGGGCRECGDVTHLRKDCPKVVSQKAEEVVTVGLRNDRNLECLDEEIAKREKQNVKNIAKKNSTVKF